MTLTTWMLIITTALAQPDRSSLQDDQQTREERNNTRQCSEIGGVYYTETGCFCPSLEEFINLNQESEKRKCHNQFAEEQMSTLLEINSIRDPLEENCAGVCLENQALFGCPNILKTFLSQDQKSSHLGIVSSPISQCETDGAKPNPSHLEADINQADFIESFIPLRPVSSPDCLPQTTNRVGGRSGRGRRGRISGRAVTTKDQTRFVADYYYSMKKLERGIEQTLTSLASLGEMVGEEGHSLLPEVACDFQEFPALVEKCENLKQCSAPGKSLDVAEQTIQALQAKKLLEDKLKKSVRPQITSVADQYIQRNRTGAWSKTRPDRQNSEAPENLSVLSEDLKSLTDQEKKLTSTIGMIDELYPWINGNKFKSGLSDLLEEEKESPQQVVRLLKDQAEVTSLELMDTLKEQKQALKCLNSQVYDPEQCQNTLQVIASSPKLDDLESPNSYGLRDSSLSALKAAQCREEARDKRESANDLMEGLALDALLMAGTLGLTGIALGGKAAVKVARVLSAGRATKPTRGMTGALLSAEVLASMDHVQDTFDECNENWNRIEGAKFQSSNNSCSEEIKETATLKANYKSCLMNVALLSLPVAVPGTVALARTIQKTSEKISDLRRLRKSAEESLGQTLSNDQVRAIHRAHLVGEERLSRVTNWINQARTVYTRPEIRQKATILREAGFIASQVRALMEDGVVGHNRPPQTLEQERERTVTILSNLLARTDETQIQELLNGLTRIKRRAGENHIVMLPYNRANNIGHKGNKFPPEKLNELTQLMNILRRTGLSPPPNETLPRGVSKPSTGFRFRDRHVYHAHISGKKYVVCWKKDQNGIIQIIYIGTHNNNYKNICR